jgi:phosphoglycerol transferase MdoB-like AlkP superfamily enzyme
MKKRLIFLISYYAYWLVLFILLKILFLFYHLALSSGLKFSEWVCVFYYGFALDVSTGAYLILLSSLFLAGLAYTNSRIVIKIFDVFTLAGLFLISVIAVTDLELYSYWGFRIDATPLLYADHPKEMMASISIWIVIRQLLIAAGIIILFRWLYYRFVRPVLGNSGLSKWKSIPLFLIICGILIVPIRGGIGMATLSPGSVYFSDKPFANHAALNVLYNLGYALTNLENEANPYIVTDKKIAAQLVDSLYLDKGSYPELLKTNTPNIVIILLESFTAKVIEPLGGRGGVTPNFTRLSKEGILFTNFYSSGSRSDRGMVAVLSGVPGLPAVAVIKYPQKTQHLPFISKQFKEKGYKLAFYHGGDIDFANMRSYFTNGGFEKLVSKPDFAKSTYNSRWGVHDQFVFDRLFEDLNKEKSHFFSFLFTLSSHEPFETPGINHIQGDDMDTKFLNSCWYTDSCLGDFIRKAEKTSWWKNTLIILVADHGSSRPGDDPLNKTIRYHIPMLWLGGALNCRDTTISKISSQNDLAKTLLLQCGMDASKFTLSKNILSNQSKEFAYYYFNDGFGYVGEKVNYAVDNKNRSLTLAEGNPSAQLLRTGEYYLQYIYDDFMNY